MRSNPAMNSCGSSFEEGHPQRPLAIQRLRKIASAVFISCASEAPQAIGET